MKQIIAVLILTVLLSFSTNDEKKITILWTPDETNYVYGTIGSTRLAISKSNIPVSEALQLLAQLDSAQKLIYKQAVNQMPKK